MPGQLNSEILKAPSLGKHTRVRCVKFSARMPISTSPGSILQTGHHPRGLGACDD